MDLCQLLSPGGAILCLSVREGKEAQTWKYTYVYTEYFRTILYAVA